MLSSLVPEQEFRTARPVWPGNNLGIFQEELKGNALDMNVSSLLTL